MTTRLPQETHRRDAMRAAVRLAPLRRRIGRRRFDDKILPWLLLGPALVVTLGLILFPVIRTGWLSFTDAGLSSLVTGEFEFVGLQNYSGVLSDGHLRGVFVTTVVFGLACVAGTMVVGLGVALLLDQTFRGRRLLGILVLLPWAVPQVAAGVTWRWMFNDQYGVVNWLLVKGGLTGFEGFSWFNDRITAFVAIGIVVVWQSFPFVAISLLAGFRTIEEDLIDAARVDGAGWFQRLRYITLPMLKPLVLVLIIISTIWDFKIFDQIYVMTKGGPARSTEVLSIAVWREAFTKLDFGPASALAILMFFVLAAVTLIYVRLFREEVS